MSPRGWVADWRVFGPVLIWGGLAALGLLALAERVEAYLGIDFFWDLGVYTEAVRVHAGGGNAYGDLDGLRYVYPPIVLSAMTALGAALVPLLLGFYAAALVLLLTAPMRKIALCLVLFAGLTFGMDDTFIRSVATGNLTLFAHIVLIWLLLVRWPAAPGPAFWITVFLLSLLKPYFLAYAAVPLLAIGMTRPLALKALIIIAASLAVWAVQAWLFPERSGAFLGSLRAQVFQGDPGYVTGDVGFGLYAFAALITPYPALALALHTTIVGFGAGLVLVWRRSTASSAETILVAAILVAVLANPRLKIYDAWVVQAGAIFLIISTRSMWLQIPALLGLLLVYQSVPVPRGGDLLGPDFEIIRKFAIGHLPWIVALFVLWLAYSGAPGGTAPPQEHDRRRRFDKKEAPSESDMKSPARAREVAQET
ncbi:hypothetical protein [Palleronia abyssalis]|uniref:DUF2029 domain-containing protein n=1 Tax=Palleronia abyssalis TaxID=1501240 RepID=A0A2R8BZ88_9RHOB|nr:hypothetical protein [Palleronia abyssalis]SPJ25485.1 hypothetical protein PAA8504_03336 [Palleronia abyssalis]